MKKLISVALALALVLSLGVSAFAASTYVVAGSSGLCGSNWDPSDSSNAMTLDGDIYTITYTDVPAGNYEFKVVENGSNWIGNNGANFMITVKSATDVTINYDPATGEVTYSGASKTQLAVDCVYAVGAGSGNFLNGVSWNPADASNKMTEANGVYTITYTGVAAGTYEYKFAANGAWTYSWGTGAATESGVEYDFYFGGNNSNVTVAEGGSTVTLVLDLSDIDSEGNGAKGTATVTAPATEDDSADIKFQTKDNSLRLVTWVDSLDYQEVVFNVTIDGETAAIPCTTVYSAINAGGVKLDSAAEVFNEDALYFVTYTINNIPEGVTEFDVSVTWTDLNGESNTSDVRTITL